MMSDLKYDYMLIKKQCFRSGEVKKTIFNINKN